MRSPDATRNPSSSGPRSRASRLLAVATGASLEGSWDANAANADDLRYPATIFVWGRWFLFVVCLILLIYHPDYTPFRWAAYVFCLTLQVALNGYVHYRVRSGHAVTLHWMLALSAMDVVLITGGMVVAARVQPLPVLLAVLPSPGLVRRLLQLLQTDLRLGDHGGRHLHRGESDGGRGPQS